MKKELFGKSAGGRYGTKLIVIVILLICFAVPIRLVSQIVRERERRSIDAREEVIGSWGGRTAVTGPYLTVPVRRMEQVLLEDGREVQRIVEDTAILFPETLDSEIAAAAEVRRRGIYPVPVFTARIDLEGYFDLSAFEERLREYAVDWDGLRVGFSLDSPGGIRGIDSAIFGGSEPAFEPSGTNLPFRGSAISAPVPAPPQEPVYYRFSLRVGGGGSIAMVPVARRTEVSMTSDWNAPGFFGAALPTGHAITDEGFTASWSISHLSRSLPSFALISSLDGYAAESSRFGVTFFQNDDPYPKNERSVKYAWLFLIVPFITFFLFETAGKRTIHPVQYLLAGSADIVFYLLLLSLSEHLSFTAAYAAAAGGVTLLLGAYGSTVLGGKRSGALLSLILLASYAYLLVVLRSEDYALLLGSLGLFGALALVMYLTRGISWYGTPPPCKAGEADVE